MIRSSACSGSADKGIRSAVLRPYRAALSFSALIFNVGPLDGATVIPLLLAALPLSTEPVAPSQSTPLQENFGMAATVRQFDPLARAQQLVQDLPRSWSGSYTPFGPGEAANVRLTLSSLKALGQMVDVRGEITLGSTTIPVQGNLNAASDQLDLLLLGDYPGSDLQSGGYFNGLQGFTLVGWSAPRLTNPGGQLVMTPDTTAAPAIRGLW